MQDLGAAIRRFREADFTESKLRIADRIMDHLAPKLWSFLALRCPVDEIKDLRQETLLAVCKGLPGCKADSTPEFWAWVYTIALNKLATYLERRKRMEPIPLDQLWALVDASGQVEPITASEREEFAPLRRALAELSESTRRAILLRYFEGLPHAEIGQELGKSADAVRMEIGRGLEELRAALKGVL
jgi:RNA polymerase sigma factor (sigma-70 family)